ncbi:MAG: ribonuclease Z [Spirochaetaceae bacterium]|nr:MAG: ribonuclease Z [Spirochaetaceae bacterium]
MDMEAFVLGSGGSMPLPHRHLTSMLVRREGDLFLFDCGEGTQVSLRRLNLKWKKINAIFISHTHADHVTGLPGMLMLSSQVERTEPLYVIGPPKIAEFVNASREVLEMYINYEIIVREIDNPRAKQVVYQGDGFCVRCVPLQHSRPCVGYILEEDSRPGLFHPDRATDAGVPRGPLWGVLQRGEPVTVGDGRVVQPADVMGPARSGRKVSYITDTLPLRTISDEIAGSDLVICEGMFEAALADTAHAKRHMTARDAAQIAAESEGIKSLGLIHFSPRYTERDLKRLLDEAIEVFPRTFLTRDRQHIPIPYEEDVD